jgi:hypothetical protein
MATHAIAYIGSKANSIYFLNDRLVQPTTLPTFVFSVFASFGKSGVMKENC